MRRTAVLLLLAGTALVGGACGSAMAEHDAPSGERAVVELLADGFVRFEGQRVPDEAFLLEMRRRVRAADRRADRMPWVVLRAAPAGSVGPRLEAITSELRKAGVRHVHLGEGG
jgi:hypothetical protein